MVVGIGGVWAMGAVGELGRLGVVTEYYRVTRERKLWGGEGLTEIECSRRPEGRIKYPQKVFRGSS